MSMKHCINWLIDFGVHWLSIAHLFCNQLNSIEYLNVSESMRWRVGAEEDDNMPSPMQTLLLLPEGIALGNWFKIANDQNRSTREQKQRTNKRTTKPYIRNYRWRGNRLGDARRFILSRLSLALCLCVRSAPHAFRSLQLFAFSLCLPSRRTHTLAATGNVLTSAMFAVFFSLSLPHTGIILPFHIHT